MKTAIIILATVILGGVGYYYYKDIQLLENITYQLIGINLQNVSPTLTTVTLDLRLFSQSTINAQVQALFLDVYINNTKVGSVQQVAPFIIPAMGYADAELNVNISPELLLGDALNLLTSGIATGSNGAVMVVGYAKVKSSFLTITVPFNYTTTIAALMAP